MVFVVFYFGNKLEIDSQCCFVCKFGEWVNGFVEFEFVIGELEIFVELIFFYDDFVKFCIGQQVEMLLVCVVDGLLIGDWDWCLVDVIGICFK